MFFARKRVLVQKGEGMHAKAVTTNERILHTEYSAAFDAKNRLGLPTEMPLDWDVFSDAMNAFYDTTPESLTAEIKKIAEGLDESQQSDMVEFIAKAGDDIDRLMKLKAWAERATK